MVILNGTEKLLLCQSKKVRMATGTKRMSFDNMRVGKNYFLKNHGDKTSFTILATAGKNDFQIKDLLTLEIYLFGELVQYGIGEDFELYEL